MRLGIPRVSRREDVNLGQKFLITDLPVPPQLPQAIGFPVCDISRQRIKDYAAGFPNLAVRFSWLFPFSRFCTHHLDMKQQALTYPRRSDCPGGFRSPQSTGTAFRIHPYYGVYFTQLPSLQPRLFLSCNSLYTIFKVLPILGFCFTTDVRILASHSSALE